MNCLENKNPYDLTDKAIDLLNRRAIKRFEDAKDEAAQMGFDELNVLEVTRTLYDQLRKDNQDVFLELAQERYQEAEPHGEEPPNLAWLLALLAAYNAVTKVIYQMTFFNQPDLTLDDVRKLLENHFSGGSSKRLTIADIQKEIENFFKVSHADLVGKKRTRNIIYARQIAIYLSRQMLDLPFNDIGKKFNRDHSTVMYSVTNVEEKMKESRELCEEIETLKQIIREL